MVTATELLKKAEAKKQSKNPDTFKAVRRRAWDYFDSTNQTKPHIEPESYTNNQEQNWEQYGNESKNNQEQNWEQYGNESKNNQEQNWEQYGNESKNKNGNSHKIKIVPENSLPNKKNIHLDDETTQQKLIHLSGPQEKIMRIITSHLKSKTGEQYIVKIIPKILAMRVNITIDMIRTNIKRLVNKNLLLKLDGEKGRGGYSKFCIPNNVVKTCFAIFNDAPCDMNNIQYGNINENEYGNNYLYSSNKDINNTITSLPDEWRKINLIPLEKIGFSETQLKQLYESNMTDPMIVQDAINRFAYSLEYNEKTKTYSDPLNLLMGILRKGGRWNEPNYTDPKELALRQMLEEARKKKEQQESIIKELIEIEFPEWRRKLTQDEINEIVSADTRKANISGAINIELRTYFVENILRPKIGSE